MTEQEQPPSPRPRLLWPALLTLAGVAVLIWLGAWQLARRDEKAAFITTLRTQAESPPPAVAPSVQWPTLDPTRFELRRVSARGVFIDGSATVRTTIAAPGPGRRQLSGFGRWVFQGFRLDQGGIILVNRGFVPEGRLGEVSAASGNATVTGFLRAPEQRGTFTPDDIPARREFYTRDPAGIAAALGLGLVAPFYLEAEREGDGLTPPAGIDAGELIARIPDNHLPYALTWFGLAATLIGVFGAWAWQTRQAEA